MNMFFHNGACITVESGKVKKLIKLPKGSKFWICNPHSIVYTKEEGITVVYNILVERVGLTGKKRAEYSIVHVGTGWVIADKMDDIVKMEPLNTTEKAEEPLSLKETLFMDIAGMNPYDFAYWFSSKAFFIDTVIKSRLHKTTTSQQMSHLYKIREVELTQSFKFINMVKSIVKNKDSFIDVVEALENNKEEAMAELVAAKAVTNRIADKYVDGLKNSLINYVLGSMKPSVVAKLCYSKQEFIKELTALIKIVNEPGGNTFNTSNLKELAKIL